MGYYIYLLRCEGNTIYTGITTDVKRRFAEHCDDKAKGAKYTKSHKPIKIEAAWKVDTKAEALKLEYRIKRLKKSEKERLISEKTDKIEIYGIEMKRIYA